MRTCLAVLACSLFVTGNVRAQQEGFSFDIVQDVTTTSVKNQARTGTCWSFATSSFVETELIRMGKGPLDLSEMYFVRMNYPQKVENYVRMHGRAALGQGSLAQDVTRAIGLYGLVPESVYPGRRYGAEQHDHSELHTVLKGAVDALVEKGGALSPVWEDAVGGILDAYLGATPNEFTYNGEIHTPKSFAAVLGVDPEAYVELTSFSHHPFGDRFAIEIPDNWARNQSYNVPLEQLIGVMDHALEHGFSVAWDGDVSERSFCQGKGVAIWPVNQWAARSADERRTLCDAPEAEIEVTQARRQRGFDDYSSSDDHLMHITGIARDQRGIEYYITKNSWGETGPKDGFIYMSESYVRAKTIAILVHEDALPGDIRSALGR